MYFEICLFCYICMVSQACRKHFEWSDLACAKRAWSKNSALKGCGSFKCMVD